MHLRFSRSANLFGLHEAAVKPNRTFVLAYRHLPLIQLLRAFVVGHSQTAGNVNRRRETVRINLVEEQTHALINDDPGPRCLTIYNITDPSFSLSVWLCC